MELIGDIKNYDWGKLGSESEVVKLAELNDESFVSDNAIPYSELWIGDHISGQSKVKGTGELLGDFITKDVTNNIGGQKKLPFLFKVLSIRKALSIQCHPNKEEAEKLHAKHPELYKDPNHKPELAIALTPFQALCGFRPYGEIYKELKNYEELIKLLGKDNIELINSQGKAGLQTCYSKLMKSSDQDLIICIDGLVSKFKKRQDKMAHIFLQLHQDFPYDVGSLSLFFLNLIELEAGND